MIVLISRVKTTERHIKSMIDYLKRTLEVVDFELSLRGRLAAKSQRETWLRLKTARLKVWKPVSSVLTKLNTIAKTILNQHGLTAFKLSVTAVLLAIGSGVFMPLYQVVPTLADNPIVQPTKDKLYPLVLNAPVKLSIDVVKSRATEEAEAKAAADEAARQERIAYERTQIARVEVPTSSARTHGDYTALYQAAAAKYGIPWQLLAAVHQMETGQSGNTAVMNPSGATGPMQFMPGTWAKYGEDCDGDGVASITNVADAICGAAKLLAANNGGQNIGQALYAYNHSESYVAQGESLVNQYRGQ